MLPSAFALDMCVEWGLAYTCVCTGGPGAIGGEAWWSVGKEWGIWRKGYRSVLAIVKRPGYWAFHGAGSVQLLFWPLCGSLTLLSAWPPSFHLLSSFVTSLVFILSDGLIGRWNCGEIVLLSLSSAFRFCQDHLLSGTPHPCLSLKRGQRNWFVGILRARLPESLKTPGIGTSLVVQWLRLHAFKTGGMNLIPGQGTKIPHAMIKMAKTNKQDKKPKAFHVAFSIPFSFPYKLFIKP